MLRRLRKEEKGFTLMEIIIVIVILGILALLAIPRLLGFTEQAEIASDKEYAAVIARAAELYWASHNEEINGDTATNTESATMADVDGDMEILVDDGLVDAPTTAIQYNDGAVDLITVEVDSATGVAEVTIDYGTESIVYDTANGYTTLP